MFGPIRSVWEICTFRVKAHEGILSRISEIETELLQHRSLAGRK